MPSPIKEQIFGVFVDFPDGQKPTGRLFDALSKLVRALGYGGLICVMCGLLFTSPKWGSDIYGWATDPTWSLGACPSGGTLSGKHPPEGFEESCMKEDGAGNYVKHGRTRKWAQDGRLIDDAFYDNGKRVHSH